MDNKQLYKNIRRTSNISSLPVLIYVVLYITTRLFFRDIIIKPLERAGVVVSQNGEIFLKYLLIYFIFLPMGMLLVYLLGGHKRGLCITQTFRKPQKSFGWTAKWILITIGASTTLGAVPTLIANLIQKALNTSASPPDNLFAVAPMSVFTVPDMVLAVFPMLVFAPVFEELLFRGTIFRNSESTGELFAIISTGVLFGLFHQNLSQIFSAAFTGMFLCLLYLRTRSIYPCIIAHCLINLIVVVRDYLISEINLPDITAMTGDKLILILLLLIHVSIASAVFVAGTVLGIIEFVRQTEDVKFKKDTNGITTGKKLFIYLTSPVTLVTVTYLVIITILNTANGYYWFLK